MMLELEPMYGIPQPPTAIDKLDKYIPILKIIGIILLPVVLILGRIIYVKKNKNNEKKAKKVKIVKDVYQSLIIILVGALIICGTLYVILKPLMEI